MRECTANVVFWSITCIILLNGLMWVLYAGFGGQQVTLYAWRNSTCSIIFRDCNTSFNLVAVTPLCNGSVYDRVYSENECDAINQTGLCYVNTGCTSFSVINNHPGFVETVYDITTFVVLICVSALICLIFITAIIVQMIRANKEIEQLALLEKQITT